ncbi:farnesyl pyrophosphate synthase-like [Lutzomyia longipalpis]|uniref:farnesyl pyrophosphate synthase-like n=1 Tax=Lutzomyia longipalpis TaxID=7200 RepID=UPI0024843067|nr:farnesyl pyrophosphate synthase-like [Lutzomyia longipalpis]
MGKIVEKSVLFEEVLVELKEFAALQKCDTEYLERMLRYHNENIFGGILYLDLFKALAPPSRQTDEYYQLVVYLDLIVHMGNIALVFLDDLLDGDDIRFKKTCWYKIVGYGAAANDAVIIIVSLFIVLKNHFSHLDCYSKLSEVLAESYFHISLGQQLDTKFASASFDDFTEENYDILLMSKSSCTFAIIIRGILCLAGVEDLTVIKKATDFFNDLGRLAQSQNDFWDCFDYMGSEVKTGTDISTRKCSWLSVQCIKLATPQQRAIFNENYGKKDPECVARIRALYNEMNLQQVYNKFLKDSYENLCEQNPFGSDKCAKESQKKVLESFFGKDFAHGKFLR